MTSDPAVSSNPDRAFTEPESEARVAYFDENLQAWVLSRYADVSGALLEPRLWPVAAESAAPPAIDQQQAQTRIRWDTLASLPHAQLTTWMSAASTVAQKMAEALPDSRPIDVIGEFAKPWSLTLAVQVTKADPAKAPVWATLAEHVTRSTADPENSALKEAAAAAEKELGAALSQSQQPMAGPAFISLSQTVPALLANAWHILLKYEFEFEQLHADKTLMSQAAEELLRLAGLARVLHRRALHDVVLGDLRIGRGQRVDLMVNTANHDPEQFPEPYRFDLYRFDPSRFDSSPRPSGQFALGAGGHACAAAVLIRMAMETATSALVDNFVPLKERYDVEWLGGSGFRWPAQVLAQRRR